MVAPLAGVTELIGIKLLSNGKFIASDGAYGKGIYFTSAFPEAADYAREKLNNPDLSEDEIYDNGYITEAYLNITDEKKIFTSSYGSGENIYLADNSSQIKSATDNTGDFSAENNDIRFRHGLDEVYQNRLDTIDAYIDRYRKQGKQGVGRVTIKELKEKGLAGLLDKQEYNNLLRELLYTIPVLQQAAAVNRGETAEQIVANRIDYLCNNLADNGLQAATVIGLIRDALDSAGLSNELTDEQLLYHLWKQTNQPTGERTIKEQAVDRRRDADIRFKIGRDTPPSTNTIDLSRGESFAEKFVDRMISVKLLQDEIKARGGRVPDELFYMKYVL